MSDSAVGFSISEEWLHMVQLVRQNGSIQIEKMTQKKFPYPFRLLTLDNQTRFQALLTLIEGVFKENDWSATVGVSIPNDLVSIKEFPVDEDLSQDELESQVHWEATQFLPNDLSAEYLLTYQRLNFGEAAVVLVAFRELVLHRIQQIFEQLGRHLRYLGVDTFAALSAVSQLYEINDGLTALLDVEDSKAHLVLLKGGDYLSSKKLTYVSDEENETTVFRDTAALAAFLKKESRKLILDRKIDEGEMPLSELFIYGEKASAELASALNDGPAVEIFWVDPFKATGRVPEFQEEETQQNPSVWTPAIGAALEALTA